MMNPRTVPALRACACLVTGLSVLLLGAACEDNASPPVPSTTATTTSAPTATATATPVPPDPQAADKLRYEGDYEAAIDAYAAIAARGAIAQQAPARSAQAQLLMRAERYGEARTVL